MCMYVCVCVCVHVCVNALVCLILVLGFVVGLSVGFVTKAIIAQRPNELVVVVLQNVEQNAITKTPTRSEALASSSHRWAPSRSS